MGGGGGNQNVTQEFKPPGWTEDMWKAYANAGLKISQTPYQQSGIPTLAPINDMQNTAMQLAYNRALYGSEDLNAGRGAAMNAAQGNYANPYAQNIQGLASGQAFNPAMQGFAEMSAGGTNPFTEEMIKNNTQNMADAYASGTAAQNDAAAAMAGAYGGSGAQQQQQAGAANLAKQVGQMATGARQSQYQNDFQNRLAALGGYAGTYNSDVQNQLGANAQGIGSWQADINNILSGSALTGQLSQDDYKSMEGLMNSGNNWNTYYQKMLDSLNGQYEKQAGWDANMNEYLGSVLGRASGSYGSTASTQPGQSPWAGLAGLLGTGLGAYTLFK